MNTDTFVLLPISAWPSLIKVLLLKKTCMRAWQREQQPNSKNWPKIFLKCPLPPIATKLESAGTKILLH